MGAEGFAAFSKADAVEHFFLITADAAAPSPIDGAETLGAALTGTGTTFEPVPTEATDTAIILYTPGTTGQAKGAELSHVSTMMNVVTTNRLFQSKPATDSHRLCLPLFHTFGATVQMHAGFSVAATLYLVPRFDAEQVVRLMDTEEITFFAGVPTMWWGLLNALTDGIDIERIARNLRVGVSGGAALPVEIINQVKERLGVMILEGYGLSETSPAATFIDPDGEPRAGSIGVPIWGVEVKLIDDDWSEVAEIGGVGEIAIKGHNVMKGYYGRPEGDRRGHPGRLVPHRRPGSQGRGRLLLHRRPFQGPDYPRVFNVYPREIEEVLISHPAVSLAAVIGVPHARHGEEIKAFVILEPGATVTPEEIVARGKEQMAN